ncbi:phosphatidylglycerophosphatase A family protein [Tranquillimonas alkanivorans]|uniref:Phosphatidylglycerophosphatase A n=1 Tax=Tranquillimonas alkanivorans TaxID=441119 RepID=A0A1I5RN99_9RHOB|nr:phosphatidylglycerophosphatase A [Tranquillimonas alkanivorans]SFP60022.1 phosphatidylglycerophosphatase A [Tranquillimonas alkanivorans]
MNRLIATFFYTGLLKPGPGTWGSAAAIPVAWLLHWAGGFPLLALATVLVFALGTYSAKAESARLGVHDPSEIVIDEVVGMWIALWPLSAGLWHAGVAGYVFPWPGWVGGFVMFRLFDIYKPWLVGRADRRGDIWGLMLDDVIAGVFAAVVVAAAAAVSHGVLMQ